MSNKAFIDTTVLTDCLLKVGAQADKAKAALTTFLETELPVYAIKEFKFGPLQHYVYVHNKLVQTKSWAATLTAVSAITRSRPNKAATAMTAMATAGLPKTLSSLTAKYGSAADPDSAMADKLRLNLKTLVYRAWKNRASPFTRVVQPLDCYLLAAPYENRGELCLRPSKCKPAAECCLAVELRKDPDALRKLWDVASNAGGSAEHTRRAKALRGLFRTPNRPMSEEQCRALGDAYFAFFAPMESTILTTNIKDHEPLAKALGKKAQTP